MSYVTQCNAAYCRLTSDKRIISRQFGKYKINLLKLWTFSENCCCTLFTGSSKCNLNCAKQDFWNFTQCQ